MIAAVYINKDGNRKHVIAEITMETNGNYYIMYNPKTFPYYGGYFHTLKEAEQVVKEARPAAKKLNNICIGCKADCAGSCEQIWTGCVYRKY